MAVIPFNNFKAAWYKSTLHKNYRKQVTRTGVYSLSILIKQRSTRKKAVIAVERRKNRLGFHVFFVIYVIAVRILIGIFEGCWANFSNEPFP